MRRPYSDHSGTPPRPNASGPEPHAVSPFPVAQWNTPASRANRPVAAFSGDSETSYRDRHRCKLLSRRNLSSPRKATGGREPHRWNLFCSTLLSRDCATRRAAPVSRPSPRWNQAPIGPTPARTPPDLLDAEDSKRLRCCAAPRIAATRSENPKENPTPEGFWEPGHLEPPKKKVVMCSGCGQAKLCEPTRRFPSWRSCRQ